MPIFSFVLELFWRTDVGEQLGTVALSSFGLHGEQVGTLAIYIKRGIFGNIVLDYSIGPLFFRLSRRTERAA